MWNKLTTSLGVSWNKVSPEVSTKTTNFFLLQENGSKILQEDKSKIIIYSLITNIWNTISKSAGITWNKLK